jgi:nitrate reductase / nitrite oxidoreductase, alpha subunit
VEPARQSEASKSLLERVRYLTTGEVSADGRTVERTARSGAEEFYRDRWRHDREVRSTHGVNCTGSCSWWVYVRDGIISWETQATDYPETGPDMPAEEPRGCPRGASFSWYTYQPGRVRYPYVRGALLEMWREARKTHENPVDAWASIADDPAKSAAYKNARGHGGFMRASWEEALELTAAMHVHTIERWGPDRVASVSPIPAMSPVSHASGSRYVALTGGAQNSFYDWYADLPPASPQVFGDQTDVPESADWWHAAYLMIWGSNVPVTRTPDAHFMVEARYAGQKVVVVSPDYAEHVKFADDWLPVAAGMDGALALAMGHVLFKEFYVEREVPFFADYARTYTDMPFLVTLREQDGGHTPDRFLTAHDLGQPVEAAEWKTVVFDAATGEPALPNGSLGFRWSKSGVGRWNLDQEGIEPALTLLEHGAEAVEVLLPRFDGDEPGVLRRGVPALRIGGRLVTTVYDLLLAQYGVERPGLPGEWPAGYDDATSPYTPAWQEELTGIPAAVATRIAREFARNAEVTEGRSMIILGSGVNHWFNADMSYRTIMTLLLACGCIGRNGGGWAHYVGQEKMRPATGWATLAAGVDWHRPPRQNCGTEWYYLATDQWRYEVFGADHLASPLARGLLRDKAPIDALAQAERLGWQVTYPTFDRNPLDLAREADAGDVDPARYVVDELQAGRLHFSVEDPDDPANFPRLLFVWRANLLGSSGKGHEYFLRHLLGSDVEDLLAEETPPELRPRDVAWRDEAAVGKLDLLITLDFRMTSTTQFADVILPAATWYEKSDLSCTDLHPYVHSFNAAIDPPWEARSDWDAFADLARVFSRLAKDRLGVRRDLVATALAHDTPAEASQPFGEVRDWRAGEAEPIPGKTMPAIVAVERDYGAVHEKQVSLGPLVESLGVGAKGVSWKPADEVAWLGTANGLVQGGAGNGRPSLERAEQAAEAILALSGATNGRLSHEGFSALERRVGRPLADIVEGERDARIRWSDVKARPQKTLTSPEWSGDEAGDRQYSAFTINVERLKPWHTLTGRMQFFLDHQWLAELGEQLPVWRPPLNTPERYPEMPELGEGALALRYLTPHSKWSIHTDYQENPMMLTLFRGGTVVWLSPADAARMGVADNDWVEVWNRNGVLDCRACVSPRMPEGVCYIYHAKDRHVAQPKTEKTGKQGGTHNSLTRVLLKPTHMIGGYAQLSYAINYYGCTGSQRDEVVVVRRRADQKVSYR